MPGTPPATSSCSGGRPPLRLSWLVFPISSGRCPLRHLVRRHRPVRAEAAIGIAPAGHVDQVLLAGEQRAAAHALIGRWSMRLLLETPRQLEHDPARDAVSLARVDETEERQVAQ